MSSSRGHRPFAVFRPVVYRHEPKNVPVGSEGILRGHIRPHGDGAWRIFAEAGTDPVTGKRKKVTRVIRGSRRDAEKALAALVAEADGGGHAGTRAKTFGEVVDAYLDHKSVELEATTFDTYRYYAGYLEPLRRVPVTKVTVDQLESLYVTLRRSGRKRDGGPMSASAVTSVHKISRGALDHARRRKWVASNVAEDARVPGGPARRPSPAPAEAVARLLVAAAAEHQAFPAYLRVSIAAGGRRSEVHGLRWSGVDFERNRIVLRDVIVRADGQWTIKPRLKTGDARAITIDPGTIDALRTVQAGAMDLALACETTLAGDAFIFSDDPAGVVPWNPRTTARRFTRVCLRVGLPATTRLHDLRHLAATHLLAEGVALPAVSGRLGHTRASTTLDIYSGSLPRSDEVAARIMGELLDG